MMLPGSVGNVTDEDEDMVMVVMNRGRRKTTRFGQETVQAFSLHVTLNAKS